MALPEPGHPWRRSLHAVGDCGVTPALPEAAAGLLDGCRSPDA